MNFNARILLYYGQSSFLQCDEIPLKSTKCFAFAGGNLSDLCSLVQLHEMEITFYTSQILNGLCYLHSSQILHLDLKPANIVLTENKKIAKICDMDSSRKKWSIDTRKSDVSEKIGTLWFTSPELLQFGEDPEAKPIGRATDIWSLGCVVLFMLGKGDFYILDRSGKPVSARACPAHYFTNLIADGRIPDIPARISANMHSFISCCLKSKPDERTSGVNLLDQQVFKINLDFDGSNMLAVEHDRRIIVDTFTYSALWMPLWHFLIVPNSDFTVLFFIPTVHCLPVKRPAWSITRWDSTNLVRQKITDSLPWESNYQWSNDGQRLCIEEGRVKIRPVLFVLNWTNS